MWCILTHAAKYTLYIRNLQRFKHVRNCILYVFQRYFSKICEIYILSYCLSSTFYVSRAIAVVAPHRQLIFVAIHLHDVTNYETGIIHSLNGSCAKTMSCVGFTTLCIF